MVLPHIPWQEESSAEAAASCHDRKHSTIITLPSLPVQGLVENCDESGGYAQNWFLRGKSGPACYIWPAVSF